MIEYEIHFFSEGLIPTVQFVPSFSSRPPTKFALMGKGVVLGLNPTATAFQAALQYEKQIHPTRRGRKKNILNINFKPCTWCRKK